MAPGSNAPTVGRLGIAAFVAAMMVVMSVTPAGAEVADRGAPAEEPVAWASYQIVPTPALFTALPGETFELTASSHIVVLADDPDASVVAERFATWLRRPTGFELPVGSDGGGPDITLALDAPEDLGAEGYTLGTDSDGVRISATTAEGLFRGLTTLRQMLPAAAESDSVQPGPWTVAGADIIDHPRFEYRGIMLDVSRHFFGVDDVVRLIDQASLYKLNHLHLHLTDDPGWRLSVPAWPLLTAVGGASDIDGGEGGYYTEEDYATIVAHAAERYIDIVAEIDMPGHTTAALNAYPELTCDGVAPPPHQREGPGEVSLCVDNEVTYEFLGDVFDTVVEQTPGEFLHIGTDEAIATEHDDYLDFVPRAAGLAVERGRRVIVYHEAAVTPLPEGSVVQYWGIGDPETTGRAREAVDRGLEVILSPANLTYFDMQYDHDTPYGIAWAGLIPLSVSYDWNPGTLIEGVPEGSVLGVEALVWTERIADRAALDYMAFPRLASIAEMGWSPATGLVWEQFRIRVAAQAPRWDLLGINYFRSPEVPWPSG